MVRHREADGPLRVEQPRDAHSDSRATHRNQVVADSRMVGQERISRPDAENPRYTPGHSIRHAATTRNQGVLPLVVLLEVTNGDFRLPYSKNFYAIK